MKTLTAPAAAQSKMRGIEARCLVTVAFADGLTLRVTDQSISGAPDGNDYLGLLVELPEVVGGFDDLAKTNEPRELRLSFANSKTVAGFSRFSDLLISHPIAFATVTIKWWMKGADASADLITDFVGQAEEAGSIRADTVEVIVSGIEMAQRDPLPLYKINTTDFPNAAPESVGRVCGPVIGTVEDVPVYPVDAGARNLLRSYITSASTGPLELSDASRFPSSGTVIVGQEEIAYTGKSGDDLTGLSRAQNGTTAVFHNKGSSAIEKKAEYVYLVTTFPMKDITRVRIAGVALGGGEYELDLVDTALLPGSSVVSLKLNTPAVIQRHSHEIGASASETTDNVRPTADDETGSDNPGSWLDDAKAYDLSVGDATTFAYSNRTTWGGAPPAGQYSQIRFKTWSPLAGLGEIVTATYHCKYQYEETNYIVNQNDAYIDGIRISPKASITEMTWAAPTTWSALVRNLKVKIRPDDGFGLRIYDIWLVVTYVQTSSQDIAYAPAGADAVVNTPVTIDGDGVYDSLECTGLADGAITGAALTLIERPDYVMEFIQRVLAGRTAAEIDSTSYAASGTTYATKGWKFAGVLNREWGAGELLAALALEAQSDQFWESASGGAVHRLLYDDPAPTSVDVTVVDGDLFGEVELALTPRDSIVNIVEAHFERNYNEGLSSVSQEAFLGLARKEDSASKASYGSRPASFNLEFVRVQTHADSVSQRLLDKLKEPRWLARVPLAWTKAAALERGDLIDLNIALFSTMGTRPKFKVVNISRSFQEEAWEVEAVEVN